MIAGAGVASCVPSADTSLDACPGLSTPVGRSLPADK